MSDATLIVQVRDNLFLTLPVIEGPYYPGISSLI